jgi:hypothetical protein
MQIFINTFLAIMILILMGVIISRVAILIAKLLRRKKF